MRFFGLRISKVGGEHKVEALFKVRKGRVVRDRSYTQVGENLQEAVGNVVERLVGIGRLQQ
jgi:hypothetical protein